MKHWGLVEADTDWGYWSQAPSREGQFLKLEIV
jgi:hypothetical protein